MLTIQDNNYFQLLGLPVSFEVDHKQLKDNYRKIQKSIHPDNFSSASDMQRRLSIQKAAQINDAFQTLKTPLKRAIYLLSLTGVTLHDNDNSLDPAFLMEQMELRENLAAVSSAEQPMDALDVISGDVKSRIRQISDQLSDQFPTLLADHDTNGRSTDNKNDNTRDSKRNNVNETLALSVKELVLKMQFLNRLQEECMNMEEDLADSYNPRIIRD